MGVKANRFAIRVARRAAGRMPDLCVVISTSSERDDRGGVRVLPTELPVLPDLDPAELIPCRVEGRAGQEREVGGIVLSVTIYTMRLMALKPDGKTAVVVQQKDRVYVLPRGTVPGRLLEVETMAYREGVTIDVVGLLAN